MFLQQWFTLQKYRQAIHDTLLMRLIPQMPLNEAIIREVTKEVNDLYKEDLPGYAIHMRVIQLLISEGYELSVDINLISYN